MMMTATQVQRRILGKRPVTFSFSLSAAASAAEISCFLLFSAMMMGCLRDCWGGCAGARTDSERQSYDTLRN